MKFDLQNFKNQLYLGRKIYTEIKIHLRKKKSTNSFHSVNIENKRIFKNYESIKNY